LKITIPISVGELLDKISILQIKSKHTDNPHVSNELKTLTEIAKQKKVYDYFYISQLLDINNSLWKIEDDLRELEKYQDFGDLFVKLARSVYKINDTRSLVKKEINEKYNSEYQEVKCYNV